MAPTTRPYEHWREKAIRAELKRLDREAKRLAGASDFAYDLVINDRGARLRQVQAEQEQVWVKQDALRQELAYRAQTEASASGPVAPVISAPPWTMTRRAYQDSRARQVAGGVPIWNAQDGRDHEAAVRQAVAEGQPVPDQVRAEYGLLAPAPV
ncbi:MAG: hypothetical protein KJ734_09990, partial [Chloroflexi bacterium]|nr:hypothetical protein [Chloroflexota bacterium]